MSSLIVMGQRVCSGWQVPDFAMVGSFGKARVRKASPRELQRDRAREKNPDNISETQSMPEAGVQGMVSDEGWGALRCEFLDREWGSG